MNKIEITFKDIKSGDRIESVCAEDDMVSTVVGTVFDCHKSRSGKEADWIDERGHHIASNWRNKDHTTYFRIVEPKFKVGDKVSIIPVDAYFSGVVVRIVWSSGSGTYFYVVESGVGTRYTHTESVLELVVEPVKFEVDDVVITIANGRVATVVRASDGTYNGCTRVAWSDSGIKNTVQTAHLRELTEVEKKKFEVEKKIAELQETLSQFQAELDTFKEGS